MKKYLQIGAVVIIFAALVIFRQLKGSDEAPVVGNTNSSNTISPQTQTTQTNSQESSTSTPSSSKTYKDGTYTGSVADAYYGNLQVQVTISGGKITDVNFLQYPNDNRTSVEVNTQAMPLLKSEAITAQSAQVDIVSGASQTSQAFQESLSSALQQAV